MIDPELFRGPAVRIALAGITITFFALYATQVAVAQYLQWGAGLTALEAGLWTLPSVLAYLAASTLGPAAVRRVPAVRVIGAGLLIIAGGCVLFALAPVTPAGDLALIVAGGSLFSIGLAPLYALATDVVVSGARSEQAGTAGAVTETGAELGGALGIALLGSLGVAVYRHTMGEGTFGDAVARAAALPGPAGAELIEHARAAYDQAFTTIGGSAALLTAVAGLVVLRRARRDVW